MNMETIKENIKDIKDSMQSLDDKVEEMERLIDKMDLTTKESVLKHAINYYNHCMKLQDMNVYAEYDGRALRILLRDDLLFENLIFLSEHDFVEQITEILETECEVAPLLKLLLTYNFKPVEAYSEDDKYSIDNVMSDHDFVNISLNENNLLNVTYYSVLYVDKSSDDSTYTNLDSDVRVDRDAYSEDKDYVYTSIKFADVPFSELENVIEKAYHKCELEKFRGE